MLQIVGDAQYHKSAAWWRRQSSGMSSPAAVNRVVLIAATRAGTKCWTRRPAAVARCGHYHTSPTNLRVKEVNGCATNL
jgi:hypothetical protein